MMGRWVTFWVLLSVLPPLKCQPVDVVHLEPSTDTYHMHMGETLQVHYNLTDNSAGVSVEVSSDDPHTVEVSEGAWNNGTGPGTFLLHGLFLGTTDVRIIVTGAPSGRDVVSRKVVVIRRQRAVDVAFTASVAILVSLIYVNFGCAVDWRQLLGILKRPVGPAIGLVCQFLLMPLLSYALGLALFPDRPDMRLGLLFTGVSPAGGASNVWTCVLDGNIDLSVTMTTVSTVAAFALMPLWLFTLGPHVFAEARVAVPYRHIATLAVALVVPLAVGYLVQRRMPRLSALLVRALKGFSALLILFIVVFASVTNAYLFGLFTWRIAVAGLALPWLGYTAGWLAAWTARQPRPDALAIAVETGVQNTGIAIFLLRFSLPQPQADLTTVVPVAIAVMTPLPLAAMYLVRRVLAGRRHKQLDDRPDDTAGQPL